MRSLIVLTALAVLGACATTTPPRGSATRQSPSKEEISVEVERVCALPAAERKVELQRIKAEYGFVLFCGKE